jgi:hypothetical protein
MADLREGLLAPRGASEDDRDDVFEGEADFERWPPRRDRPGC